LFNFIFEVDTFIGNAKKNRTGDNTAKQNNNGGALDATRYTIKFVSDLPQVGSFLRVIRFPPPIKLTATI
jgi:hypothetical protein